MSECALRIGMVALDFHREGGSEGRTAHLVDRLVADGHDVHLVGARIMGNWDRRVVQRRIPTPEHPHWIEVLLFARRAEAVVRSERYDVVHNQIRPFVPGIVTVGGGSHRFYLDEVLPREQGAWRAAVRRRLPLHRMLLAMERQGFDPRRCPFIIANSQLSRSGILRHYRFPPERIVVAHNGVDPVRFTPESRPLYREATRRHLGIGPEEYTVLFVGQGFARKGLGALLAALAALGRRGVGVRLVVVGRGSSRPWMREAARLGIDSRVTMVGHVSNPVPFYAAADAFALPTFFDPFANATLEAMAAGLPVVTSGQNGAAEVLRSGVDGLVVDGPDDVTGLVEALSQLADPAARRAMGQSARQTALRCPWEQSLERTLATYREVIGAQ
ncbi:MAG: glycosyl transferase group 1 [candidate division NC10 bacterium]|nr:glycosyl transferase group 1 [candidate division NC10 bacterium]